MSTPGDQSLRAGDASHVQRDVAAAAAQVQAPVAAAQPGFGQQPQRGGPHDLCEQVQPSLALFPAGNRVGAGRWICASSDAGSLSCPSGRLLPRDVQLAG
jgi:hypothetical protein